MLRLLEHMPRDMELLTHVRDMYTMPQFNG